MRLLAAAVIAAALLPATAFAQTAPTFPVRLPSSGGEVIIPSAGFQRAYDEIGYAPARRAGDTLYVSGAIVFRAEGEGTDAAAFEGQVRRALTQLDRTVKAAGVTMNDVALINSFHVWEGPDFTGTKDQQIEVIARVWREFADGPRPAWTAVGTSGLLGGTGIVEIQLTVHSPLASN
ncbi:Rid family hydrolase [Brevundimonas lenta]|uniref:Enamine deaminase RidA (YjgF/YER057c/UK114 family) n=1 Tax=Brevundimonas lenta TaxID=424796 RepID=A0A7W6JFH3_9CAUL|nr:Rid family hydrolase [Brevundimonas lenta]MBB4084205.1 enamine deaminase RidA (YjgF/YER057c/UK114 family) [Brevundimonas lenta]